MNIYLISFYSELNKQTSVVKTHETLLSEIEKYFTLHLVDYKDMESIPADELKIVFIATGGIEKLVSQCFESLPHPLTLLTDGLQNSLAATLEITTWLRYKGMKSQIIYGELPAVIHQLQILANNFSATKELLGKRVGVIGPASPWLIASDVDYLLAKRRWGLEFKDIKLDEVYELYNKISDDEVSQAASVFAARALALLEATPKDILKAMRLYQAIKIICERENLTAITLSCFNLLEQLRTTGCMALSLLNDDGIVAGCEGDLQSIFTLLTVKAVTGQCGFMGNPSMLDQSSNEVLLAHCTVATSLTERYIIRNHFESCSGIGIQGILPTGEVTIVKCGGESLDEFFISAGVLTENTNYIHACRTQVKIRLDKSVSYFLRNPLGNHHILIPGNHVKALEEFYLSNNCRRIE